MKFAIIGCGLIGNKRAGVEARDAIDCEVGADEFLTFDGEQANLARAAGLPVWNGKNAQSS